MGKALTCGWARSWARSAEQRGGCHRAKGSPAMLTNVLARPAQGVSARHLLEPLNREWNAMLARGRHDQTVRGWSRRHEPLAEAASLRDLDELHRCFAVDDALLLALIAEHQGGDRLAGRVLLQFLLPGLVKTSRRCTRPDAFEAAVAAAWSRLADYPAERCRKGVAGRILLDVLHEITEVRRRRTWEDAVGNAHDVEDHDRNLARRGGHSRPVEEAVEGLTTPCLEALRLLLLARDAGVLTAAEATLLAETYVSADDDGQSNQRLAAKYGITQTCLRARQSRAVRRLAAAVRADGADLVAESALATVA